MLRLPTSPWLLSERDLFEVGIQPIEEEDYAGSLIADGEGAPLSPLCSFSPPLMGESGYSDWVGKCAMKIFPIVGISYEDYKLQFLALLTFLEEERRVETLVTPSMRASKASR